MEGCDPAATADLLSHGAATKSVQTSSASAAYVRGRRLAFLGAVLKLIDDNPDVDLAFVTVSHPAWYFNLRYDWSLLTCIPEDFWELLEPRISTASGFLIVVPMGRYHPNARNMQLLFRGYLRRRQSTRVRTVGGL